MRKPSYPSLLFWCPLPRFHGDGQGFPCVWAKRSPTAGGHPFQRADWRPETGRSRRLPRFQQPFLHLHKRLEGRAVFAEAQDPLPRLADELRGAVDDFLQHRLDASALGRVAHRLSLPVKPIWPTGRGQLWLASQVQRDAPQSGCSRPLPDRCGPRTPLRVRHHPRWRLTGR